MKKKFLFPRSFQVLGYLIAIPTFVLLILSMISSNMPIIAWMNQSFPCFALIGDSLFESKDFCFIATTSFSSTFLPVLLTLGLLFIAFAQENVEDEYISQLREKSLVWAVIVYNLIFIVGTLVIYGIAYISFVQLSLYLVLILYIFRFKYELYRLNKSLGHEE